MSRYLPNTILVVTIVALFLTIKPAPRHEKSKLIGTWKAEITPEILVELMSSRFFSVDDPMLKKFLDAPAGITELEAVFERNGSFHFQVSPPKWLANRLLGQIKDSRYPQVAEYIFNWYGNWKTDDLSTQPTQLQIEHNGRQSDMFVEWIDENTIKLIPPQLSQNRNPLTFERGENTQDQRGELDGTTGRPVRD